MLDISKLLEEIKQSPYDEITVSAPHSGVLTFADIKEGDKVTGRTGAWQEKPGTALATLERERNPRSVECQDKGEIKELHRELDGRFVEAGTPIAVIRHFLSKDEVLRIILKQALYLFAAPERAKYYFAPDADKKIRASGHKAVHVKDGMELLIMSRMKREAQLNYSGPEGVIFSIFFEMGQSVDAGEPLLGICPAEQLALVEDVVIRVQTEWEERD